MHDWYFWPLLRYVLYEYEERLAGEHQHRPKLRWREITRRDLDETVEHILPQKADDPYWKERFDAEAYSRVINDLGNLCLTNNNSSYRNKSFPNKKGIYEQSSPCYSNSPLYQERDLASYQSWTPETITERREKLLSFIWDRWEVETVPVDRLRNAGVSAEAVGQVAGEEADEAAVEADVGEVSEGDTSE